MMAEKKDLPSPQKLDTVSPATRLLDKRRRMYENQEKFIQRKREFSQAEMGFKTREEELRKKDQDLQKQLITYASYLDSNMKTMNNCKVNIEKLKVENEEKAKEIEKKK